MRRLHRKPIMGLAGLSLAVVVGVVILGRQRIVEQWYLYRLASDDAAVVDAAAAGLASMHSLRAIGPLIDEVPRELARGRLMIRVEVGLRGFEHWTDSAILKALHDLGEPAREAVEQAAERTGLTALDDLLQAMRNGRLRYDKDLPRKRRRLETTIFE